MKARIRSGFTLVELLVVIGIILIILALILPLIMRIMQAVEETQVIREVKLLDQGCEQFKATFGKYPPGRIMICEDMRGYKNAIEQHLCQGRPQTDPKHQEGLAPLAMVSMEYLQSIFPGIDLNAGHDWNGDGVIDDRQYILNGSEAMVFFLGGMRYGKGAVDLLGSNRSVAMGFNTDKTKPTQKATSTRLGPFFEFEASRIQYEVTQGVPAGNAYPSAAGSPIVHDWTVGVSTGLVRYPGETYIGFFPRYVDLWNTPYAYLCSRGHQMNDYSYMFCPYCYKLGLTTGFTFNYHLWFSDYAWLPTPTTPGLWVPVPGKWGEFAPYIKDYQGGNVTYHNPGRFQIISAGRDRKFGSGGFLKSPSSQAELSLFQNYRDFPEQAIPLVEEKQANYDNITNINFGRVVPR